MAKQWTKEERERAFANRLARVEKRRLDPARLTQPVDEEAALLAECEINEAAQLLYELHIVRGAGYVKHEFWDRFDAWIDRNSPKKKGK